MVYLVDSANGKVEVGGGTRRRGERVLHHAKSCGCAKGASDYERHTQNREETHHHHHHHLLHTRKTIAIAASVEK